MKRLLGLSFFVFMILSVVPNKGNAQRLLPRQTGLSLSVGTTQIDGFPHLHEKGFYNINVAFHQYLKKANYYFIGLDLHNLRYSYQDYKVPVRNYLLQCGFMTPVIYDYTRTFLIYAGIAGVGGYQYIEHSSTFENGARLLTHSRFVGGGSGILSVQLLVTNNFILECQAKGTFLWGTKLDLFYPTLSLGFKYNL